MEIGIGLPRRMAELADAGCDELIIFPCADDPEQVDLLADAAGL